MSTSMLRRQMKNIVHNFSEAEIKVREATSNDPWGPSSSLMSEISDLTYNMVALSEIMTMLWKRLNDTGKNWRHVYKALTLLEYLIKTGSDRVAQQSKENIYVVQILKDFQYIDKDGKDQGVNVREKAKQILILLTDEDKLQEERAHALKTKEKMAQTTNVSSTSPAPVIGSGRGNPAVLLGGVASLQLEMARNKEKAEQSSKAEEGISSSDPWGGDGISAAPPSNSDPWGGDGTSTVPPSSSDPWGGDGTSGAPPASSDPWGGEGTSTAPPASSDPWGGDGTAGSPPASSDPWGGDGTATTPPASSDPWGGDATSTVPPASSDPWGSDRTSTAPPTSSDPWESDGKSTAPPASSDPWGGDGSFTPAPASSDPWGGNGMTTSPPASSDPWGDTVTSSVPTSNSDPWGGDGTSTTLPSTTDPWENNGTSTSVPTSADPFGGN